MKEIIDIPKKDYDKMCKGELVDTILVAIKNGTPIPEGHEKLCDAEKVIEGHRRLCAGRKGTGV